VRAPVDLDRATAQEIDVLPWVGPALAGRIVANRDSFGPFGSLEALGRVKGIGSATRKRLAALVTFSGVPSSRR
jgi:competence protein ComEA